VPEDREGPGDPVQRPGFLTRVGFLNAYAFYNRTSPIHRGAFIVKQVLGTPIGTPAWVKRTCTMRPSSSGSGCPRRWLRA
jgi:hypothetical protein